MADLSAANSRALSIRLPNMLYNHLVVQAHLRETSLAEALRQLARHAALARVRQALERDIDRIPGLQHPDGSPGVSMEYRTLLEAADVVEQLDELEGDASA